MKLNKGWAIALSMTAIFVAFCFSTVGQGSHDAGRAGASDSSGPRGTLALVRTYEKLHLPMSIWTQPPVFLPNKAEALLTVDPLAGNVDPYPKKQVSFLLQWVRHGHQLIWVTGRQDSLLTSLHLNVIPVPKMSERATHVFERTALPTGVLSAKMNEHSRQGSSWLAATDFTTQSQLTGTLLSKHGTRLYTDDAGQVLGAAIPVGAGQITVWVAPSVWENQAIGASHNFMIPWMLLNSKPILYDEFAHGIETDSMLGTTFSHGRQFALICWLIALCTYFWASFVRLGSATRAPDDQPRLGRERHFAMAWHLRRPRMRLGLLKLSELGVRRKLARLFACPAMSDWHVFDHYVNSTNWPQVQESYRNWRASVQRHSRARELEQQTLRVLHALDEVLHERSRSLH